MGNRCHCYGETLRRMCDFRNFVHASMWGRDVGRDGAPGGEELGIIVRFTRNPEMGCINVKILNV